MIPVLSSLILAGCIMQPPERSPQSSVSIAEDQSLWSQALQTNDCRNVNFYISVAHPGSAFQNILAFGALLTTGAPDYFTDKEVQYFAQKAYEQQYQGDWAKLQILLEECTTFQEYEATILEMYSSRDFYGNIVKGIRRYQKTLVRRRRDTRGPVRHKVRRRGYNDKGQRVEEWKRGRSVWGNPTQQIPKIDRRGQVKNQILRQREISPEGSTADHHVFDDLASLENLAARRKELVAYVTSRGRNPGDTELSKERLDGVNTDDESSAADQSSEIEKFQTLWYPFSLAISDPEKVEDRNRDQRSLESST